jgi:hypothetical protein
MDVTGKRLRRVDVIAVVGLAAWLAVDLTARTVFGPVPWPDSVVDYRIMYDAGRQVYDTHRYPSGYPYPPPAVAAHAATAALSFPAAAALWAALTGLAAAACYALLAGTLGLTARPGALALLPLAHLAAAYYFQWDLRSLNCNLVVLASVLAGAYALTRGRDAAAGFWFALAVALKFLPVLLLPYLLWTRRTRAFAWAAVWSVVFWVAVPLIAFGPTGFPAVYAGWFGELTHATDPTLIHRHPILISLGKAAAHVAGTGTLGAKAIVLGVSAVWVLVGLAGAAACRRGRKPGDGRGILTDVSLLVLGPAAVSPYLEAYHLVAVCVPALLVLVAATDRGRGPWQRAAAGVAFAAAVVLVTVLGPWPLRGLVVNAQCLLLCGTAVWLAWPRREIVSMAEPRPVPDRLAA